MTTMSLFDNSGLKEDSIKISNVFLDGEPVEYRDFNGGFIMSFCQCEAGDVHVIDFMASDLAGNTSQLTMNMTIVHDIPPEDRQKMRDNGYSDEQISESLTKLYEQHMEDSSVTYGPL